MAFNLGGYGENNKILNNPISEGFVGIALHYCSNWFIKGNIIHHIKASAISISSSSTCYVPRFNTISQNIVHNCRVGLTLKNVQNNTIISNLFFDQIYYGICVLTEEENPPNSFPENSPSRYNSIMNNTLYNNSNGDLVFYNDTANNIVVLNKFLNNITSYPHILENGSFNHIRFNYYAEWPNKDTNHDNIIDVPYPIAGNARNLDLCPLASMNASIDISLVSNISFCCQKIGSHSSFTNLNSPSNRVFLAIIVFLFIHIYYY